MTILINSDCIHIFHKVIHHLPKDCKWIAEAKRRALEAKATASNVRSSIDVHQTFCRSNPWTRQGVTHTGTWSTALPAVTSVTHLNLLTALKFNHHNFPHSTPTQVIRGVHSCAHPFKPVSWSLFTQPFSQTPNTHARTRVYTRVISVYSVTADPSTTAHSHAIAHILLRNRLVWGRTHYSVPNKSLVYFTECKLHNILSHRLDAAGTGHFSRTSGDFHLYVCLHLFDSVHKL